MSLHRFRLTGLLLLVALFSGCDRVDPLEPAIQAASTAGSGPTVNAPSGTNAVAVSQSRIDVGWRDNSTNENGFEVHRSTAGASGAFALLASTGAGITSYGDAGLAHSTQYCYKVRSFRTTGRKTSYSQFSMTACATTPAPPPPTPPIAPSGADAAPVGSTAIVVFWIDNSTNEDGFRVERSTDGGAIWATVGTTSADGAGLGDHGRTSEQQVCYRVIAFNAGGDSPPSNSDCTTPPAGPTNLTATIVDAATMEVELTWADNSAVEDGYEVWADPCCSPGSPVSLPANSTSFRFFWDFADAFYVVATKDGGRSDASNLVTPTIP